MKRNRLFWAMLLNIFIAIGEVIGGLLANSLALISDAFHNINDFLALLISYLADLISKNKKKDSLYSYGYRRLEILSALLNGLLLLGLFIFLLYEAYERIKNPPKILGLPTFIVAVLGLVGNILGAGLLRKESHENLNIRSAFLHLVSDSLSSVGVIISSLLILWKNIYIADTVMSLIIAFFVLFGSYDILKNSIHILLEGTPYHLNPKKIEESISGVPGVKEVHHLHIWQIDSKEVALSAHIVVEDQKLSDAEKICNTIEKRLREDLGINHSTLQLEVEGGKNCHCEF